MKDMCIGVANRKVHSSGAAKKVKSTCLKLLSVSHYCELLTRV